MAPARFLLCVGLALAWLCRFVVEFSLEASCIWQTIVFIRHENSRHIPHAVTVDADVMQSGYSYKIARTVKNNVVMMGLQIRQC